MVLPDRSPGTSSDKRGSFYDLHIHTKWSRDSVARPEDVVKVAFKKKLAGIAITDHNSVIGAVEAKRRARDKIDVIIGEEIRTAQGELTGLNLTECIPPGLGAAETIDRIREQGGVVVIPHPFYSLRRGSSQELRLIADEVDLVEVFNGRSLAFDNARAKRLAERLGKPGVGGSDAHFLFEVGTVAVDLSKGLLNPGRILVRPRIPLIPIVASFLLKMRPR